MEWNYTTESFLDSPTCLADLLWGQIVEASNAISELALPRACHQWPKTLLALEIQVKTLNRRSLAHFSTIIHRFGMAGDDTGLVVSRLPESEHHKGFIRNGLLKNLFRPDCIYPRICD